MEFREWCNLTKPVELREFDNGSAVARFTLAVSNRRRDKTGQWIDEETLFFAAEAWDTLARWFVERTTKDAMLVQGSWRAQRYDVDGDSRHRQWIRLSTAGLVVGTGKPTPNGAAAESTGNGLRVVPTATELAVTPSDPKPSMWDPL